MITVMLIIMQALTWHWFWADAFEENRGPVWVSAAKILPKPGVGNPNPNYTITKTKLRIAL